MIDNINSVKEPPILPRMRTVPEAAAEIKAADPNTAITEYHIRQLALSGVLPRVKAGRKLLINLDTLIEYLTDPTAEKFNVNNAAVSNSNGIRRIV